MANSAAVGIIQAAFGGDATLVALLRLKHY